MPADKNAKAKLLKDPYFKALAKSLWRETELRGTALMVGAGMSRNALLPSVTSPKPPLWGTLLHEMTTELGLDKRKAPGALRLAQQYELEFGRGRLEGLIRRLIPDASWQPGQLHQQLLRLPWTDVLTTNYDTLLERAADQTIDPLYEVVLTPQDIARTRAPRIVKLHGTLPSHTPFIITEDDYNSYPRKYAPFVNFARQILIENDLCLLGFSGDDPNFDAWSVWVHQELAQYARTLFLVGVFNLTGEARDKFSARGITPIDLSEFLPKGPSDPDVRNASAMALFIEALNDARSLLPEDWPWDDTWPPANSTKPKTNGSGSDFTGVHDTNYATDYIKQCLGKWKIQRDTYPGWLEMPPRVRSRIESHARTHLTALFTGLGGFPEHKQPEILANVLWYFDILHGSLHKYDLEWLDPLILSFERSELPARDSLVFGRLMLRSYRESEDEEKFEQWRMWLQDASDWDDEVSSLVAYERALWHRDRLDFKNSIKNISSIRGNDPIWTLRRAALLSEAGASSQATTLIIEAFRDCRSRFIRDRKSIWIKSRLGWISLLGNVISSGFQGEMIVDDFEKAGLNRADWYQRFNEGECNPWSVVEHIDSEIERNLKMLNEDKKRPESSFDAGFVRRHGITFRSEPLTRIDRYIVRMTDNVGIPHFLREHLANLTAGRVAQAAAINLATDSENSKRILIAASRIEKPLLENFFNRVNVALLDLVIINMMIERLTGALDFSVAKLRSYDDAGFEKIEVSQLERAKIIAELLSRLYVRLSSEEAIASLRRLLTLHNDKNWQHHMLQSSLENMMRRCIEAIDINTIGTVFVEILRFPLPAEVGTNSYSDEWPTPLLSVQAVPQTDDTIRSAASSRADELLDVLVSGDLKNATIAARMILFLIDKKLINVDQSHRIGLRVWQKRAESGLRLSPDIAFPLITKIPAPNWELKRQAIRSILITDDGLIKKIISPSTVDIISAVHSLDDRRVEDYLSNEELIDLTILLLRWRPKIVDESRDLFSHVKRENEHIEVRIGWIFSKALLPLFNKDNLNEGLAAELINNVQHFIASRSLAALPQFVRLGAMSAEEAKNAIHYAILSKDQIRLSGSLHAISNWLDACASGDMIVVPDVLLREATSLVAMRQMLSFPMSLDLIANAALKGALAKADIDRVKFGLANLLSEADYTAWSGDDIAASLLTLTRAGAVKLCLVLKEAGETGGPLDNWIDAARIDPMPEVRHVVNRDSSSSNKPVT